MRIYNSLSQMADIELASFSKVERIFIEAELFAGLCEGLKDFFKAQFKDYFSVMNFNMNMENEIMEVNFVRCIINDILATEEYALQGIAYYTSMPEEVIYEVAIGKNVDPSSSLLRKIMELDRTLRPELYRTIMKKIIVEHPSLQH